MSDVTVSNEMGDSVAHQDCGCPTDTGETSRRAFLAGAAATGALAGLTAAGLDTRTAFAAAGYRGDVLVVLSFRGGADGLNIVVPRTPADVKLYEAARPHTHIPQKALLHLTPHFGLHPAMKPLMPWWQRGRLSFVHAVGQQSASRSHFQAMADLENASPGTPLRTGWLDRTLGLRRAGSVMQGSQVGSYTAAPMFLGQDSPEMVLSSVPDFRMLGAATSSQRHAWSRAISKMQTGAPLTLRAPTHSTVEALNTLVSLQRHGYRPRAGAHYPTTELGDALKNVAWLIKARVGLQVAAVDYGDWDMHADMGTVNSGWLHSKLTELSHALNAFAHDLGPRFANVNLITLTEFGRRVKQNGSGGTDHGHGQAVMLLGGGVRGGQMHGGWPGLATLDQGDLVGKTDYRSLLAEILEKRCGASASAISEIFPGLGSQRAGIVRPR